MGIAYDVVTDHDLHEKGVEILASYKVVMTGSHPEYHTERTLDALQGYTESGGRLMYLGGNGFYWRVALSDDVPGAIEVRRTEGGIRTWPAEPGEYYHAFDGAYGGLWRRSDRPPNLLCGIGFSSQGTFVGDSYRQTPAARDNHHAWIFEGVKDELFGGYGFSGGGAAGFELDRLDHRLGSPLNAVVLASSEGHDRKNFVVVHEERLGFTTTIPGQTLEELIRADMTYIEKPKGGAVFSVGLDHLLRQPAPQQVRQRRLATHLQRGEPIRRARAEVAVLAATLSSALHFLLLHAPLPLGGEDR